MKRPLLLCLLPVLAILLVVLVAYGRDPVQVPTPSTYPPIVVDTTTTTTTTWPELDVARTTEVRQALAFIGQHDPERLERMRQEEDWRLADCSTTCLSNEMALTIGDCTALLHLPHIRANAQALDIPMVAWLAVILVHESVHCHTPDERTALTVERSFEQHWPPSVYRERAIANTTFLLQSEIDAEGEYK